MSHHEFGIPACLTRIFNRAKELGASDIHLAAGEEVWFRVAGVPEPDSNLAAPDAEDMGSVVQHLAGDSGLSRLQEHGSLDGATTDSNGQRYRFNIFRCGGKHSIALRALENRFQSLQDLGLPENLNQVTTLRDGLVLVAGPTGSGKSTTLATFIDGINQTRAAHIITIEDPVEYIHTNKRSRVSQRQIGVDTNRFADALIDAVRQDPDVILVGELRDLETIRTAVTAAETGHLVFATVHAGDCVGAIERVTSVFPGDEQNAIRNLLSGSLRTVIAQHLLVSETASDQARRTRVLATEILHVNQAASNLIANNHLTQLHSILELHRSEGMHTLDQSLARLWRSGLIPERTARSLARNPDMLRELARAV